MGDQRRVLAYRTILGTHYRNIGDFSQAMQWFEETLPDIQRSNDPFNLALVLCNLGLLGLLLGDYATAQPALTEAYERFSEIGEKRLKAETLAMLGRLLWLDGGVTAAAETCKRVLAQPYITPSAQINALLTLGELHSAQANWAAARAAYTEVFAIAQQLDLLVARLLAQAGLAAMLLAQGDAAAALVALDEFLPDFDPHPFDPVFSAPRFLLPAIEILIANHNPRAADLLQEAWQIVQGYAEKISDAGLRHSFLTNVPVHRRLGELVIGE